jgi:GNAT superfamily N-acetyltransferase
MRHGDIQFAVDLTAKEGWGIPPRDFRRILRLDPRGSFVALEGNRRLGVATTTSYGRDVAWIGNVVVSKKFRGKHIGQQLVERMIEHLSGNRVRHIALYSFRENVPFYKRLNFAEGPKFLRLRRASKRHSRSSAERVMRMPLTFSSVLEMDRVAFGADRARLLDLMIRSRYAWIQSYSDGPSASYMLVKRYEDMNELGPWVSFRSAPAKLNLLLESALSKAQSKPVEVSCPASNHISLRLLTDQGFRVINEGQFMFYQRVAKLGDPTAVLAHGFLDKG